MDQVGGWVWTPKCNLQSTRGSGVGLGRGPRGQGEREGGGGVTHDVVNCCGSALAKFPQVHIDLGSLMSDCSVTELVTHQFCRKPRRFNQ